MNYSQTYLLKITFGLIVHGGSYGDGRGNGSCGWGFGGGCGYGKNDGTYNCNL